MKNIFPHIQSFTSTHQMVKCLEFSTFNLAPFNYDVLEDELLKTSNVKKKDKDAKIIFEKVAGFGEEEYQIKIDQELIKVSASTSHGALYAVMTLRQLLSDEEIETGLIQDYPDLKMRSIMIDIGRDKVPTLKTLKDLIEDLLVYKVNQIQLYVEGFSFEYQSFPKYIEKDHNYFSLKDFLELEDYAVARFIDLVPSENGFGHMTEWLKLDEFHELAECPDGLVYWGSKHYASTLDPSDPKSLELVKKIYADMIPHCKSKYFNMDFDEPMELGFGKSKALVEKRGVTDVYLDFFKQAKDIVTSYGKTPMVWGDVLIKHPEILKDVPKDIIFLDWGYNHVYDFRAHAKNLHENNIPFMLVPGTVTWATITGRYLDMYGSVRNAVTYAKEYSALGVMNTDWGDFGHLQYLPFSYLGFMFSLCASWSNISEEEFAEALALVIKDEKQIKALMRLSHIHELEGSYVGYGCRMFAPIQITESCQIYLNEGCDIVPTFKEKFKNYYINVYNQKLLINELNDIEQSIDAFSNNLIDQEILNSIFLLKSLVSLNNHLQENILNNSHCFDEDIKNLKVYLEKHETLWCERNLKSGFILSSKKITNLIKILDDLNRREIL